MTNIFVPLTSEYTLQIPEDVIALIGWVLWFVVLIFAVLRSRDSGFKLNLRTLSWLALLSMLVLVFTAFFGLFLPIDGSVTDGEIPIRHLMFFAAVPWMIAGGIMGVLPAALLAGMSGLLLAYLDTHNIFTPLIFITYAVIFTWCVRQPYRTRSFQLLRFPPLAAIVSFVLTLPAIFAALVLSIPGTMAVRLVSAVDRLAFVGGTFGGMVMISAVVCAVFKAFLRKAWGSDAPLKPAPGETSVKFRVVLTTLPILMVLLVVLVVGNWTSAENSAKRMMVNRITSASGVAAEGLPVLIHTGESLMVDLGQEVGSNTATVEEMHTVLAQHADSFPYFDQLAVIETDGTVIATYPSNIVNTQLLTSEEKAAIGGLTGETVKILSIPPGTEAQSAKLRFITKIEGSPGQFGRVLWGQTDLESNPLALPFIGALEDLTRNGGSAQIVGSDRTILYHSNPQDVKQDYSGKKFLTPTYFENVSAEGENTIQFFEPAGDTGWSVVVSVPFSVIQTTAWETAYPLLIIGIAAMSLVMIIVLFGLTPILKDIDQMKLAAEKLSSGDFNVTLEKNRSSGEMAQLNSAFKAMVASFKNQTKKQADLLSVTERIQGQLDLVTSLDIIMSAALERGVSSVRIVFSDAVGQRLSKTQERRFGRGKHADVFASLDDQVVTYVQTHGPLILPDFQIGKMLHIPKGTPYPASMIALPLRWKDDWLGVLWVTYQDQKSLSEDMVAFFKELAVKASEVIASAIVFDDSKTARAQLESVMDILPDAIIVSDATGDLIYHNQTAQAWFELQNTPTLSKFLNKSNLEVFNKPGAHTKWSKEVVLNNGNAYLFTANPLLIGNQKAGQAIIIEDVSQIKLRESRKSEIVTTVSHELRSPLTLIHGYAKILRLTGNLNEQQDTYIGNIIDEVDEMRSLVQNLLDMGRLETENALDITRIEAGEIASKAIDSMEAQARQKNMQITLSAPESPIYFEGDETFLAQALKNLIENAIKFSKMGRDVMLSVQPNADKVVFAVKDEGIGISPLDQRHLFEKFQRMSNPAGQNQQGSGLGLAIVKSIAERHGGEVWFESQLGKGSTFFIQIPNKSPNR